ncbi:N-acetylmuramoyl-L-alanine amidase [Domibacillus aminovorans]|uniref:N-acetylmuramoyl-L-alanine amidase n=1 Tax=Domibacillus aminovorans TaxID=29332 RepID=UPI0009EEE306|nr:N-acetylmuramoyl-L-alanine amidase [Domibacillus aminovorans]
MPGKNVAVLHGTKAKALLLECLFVDNKGDMDKLNGQAFFAEFCRAIADGIAKAVGVTPKSMSSCDKLGPSNSWQVPNSHRSIRQQGIGRRNRCFH